MLLCFVLAVSLFYHEILCTKFTHISKYKVLNSTLGVRMFLRIDYPQIFSIRAVDHWCPRTPPCACNYIRESCFLTPRPSSISYLIKPPLHSITWLWLAADDALLVAAVLIRRAWSWLTCAVCHKLDVWSVSSAVEEIVFLRHRIWACAPDAGTDGWCNE